MSGSVYEELANEQENLLKKIASNDELSSVVMGLLGRLIYVAEVEKNKPVTGISIAEWTANDGRFSARVSFHSISLSTRLMWGAQTSFNRYAAIKAGRMAKALSDNPSLGKSFQELVEGIDAYARHKGIPFKDLEMREHIITRDDVIVLKVCRRPTLVTA